MSVTSVASSILSILAGNQAQNNQPSPFSQFSSEFQQLGQDLQAGNLGQAQQDFATLSQSLANVNPAAQAPNGATLTQALNQLGQDLQAGNLTAAQQDFTTLQQDLQQSVGQAGGHGRHHHHHLENAQNSQQSGTIAQEFGQLAQSLESGNLSAAQQAFSTLQNDLQQINAIALSNAAAGSGSGLNVSA